MLFISIQIILSHIFHYVYTLNIKIFANKAYERIKHNGQT